MRRRDFTAAIVTGAVFWPREGRTEQRRIGFLSAGSADAYAPFVAAFRSALNDGGHLEGSNLDIEFRWAEGHYDRLPESVTDLVRAQPEVIATSGGDVVIEAVKAATVTSRSSSSAAAIPWRGGLSQACRGPVVI